MNVLSLFDGISCGQIALQRAGVKVGNYYASEIDKAAITVTKANYPGTKHIGDIKSVNKYLVGNIDLIIGGSPCQGFSFAGKKLNFNDNRSRLFFEYVRLLQECSPKYFLLENVNMPKKWVEAISNVLGVAPIFINSKLVSAQDRKRLYWTNIPIYEMPTDKGIAWQDICTDGYFAGSMRGRRIDGRGKRVDSDTDYPLIQYIESRKDNKTSCLTTVSKDNIATKERVNRQPATSCQWRYFTRREMEALQTLPIGYTMAVSESKAGRLIGNAWTVDVIAHILKPLADTQAIAATKARYINQPTSYAAPTLF